MHEDLLIHNQYLCMQATTKRNKLYFTPTLLQSDQPMNRGRI
jgi:hypothetical protein